MNIQSYNASHLTQMQSLWSTFVLENGVLYQPLTTEVFVHSFVPVQSVAYDIVTLVALQSDTVIGWISGVLHKITNKGYVSMILVNDKHRHKGIGRELVTQLESTLRHIDPSILSIDIVFFNPIHLPWTLSNTAMGHPNMPGVVEGSTGEQFLKACGYHQYAIQQTYGKQLSANEVTPILLEQRHSLSKQGIDITWYDPLQHKGFAALFENLKSPHWFSGVTEALNKGGPLLVVVKANHLMGFAGPLFVSSSRGVFSGIGVHSDCRGLGVGKVLFACLCDELFQLGATYMTLFTGEQNPAKTIYERQGFHCTNRFVNLRKHINT